jgi:hypothetical protein
LLVFERFQLEARIRPAILVPLARTVEHVPPLTEVDLYRTNLRPNPEASDLEVLVAIPV